MGVGGLKKLKTMKKHILNTFIIFFVGIFLSNCGENKAENHNKTKKISDLTLVKVTKVETSNVSRPIIASGTVSSASEARLAFKTGGVIQRIFVSEGQYVTQGQVLATLHLTEINAQASQAQEGLAKAERDLQRVKNLYADSVATKEQLQNATTAQKIASENIKIVGFNQQYSEIRASISGKIIKKFLNEGEVVSPGTPVFFVSAHNAGEWLIKVGLADKDWARINIGEKAEIKLEAYPDEVFQGIVKKVAETAEQSTGTFEIEISLQTQGKKMASGMMSEVQFVPSQNKPKQIIPLGALVESNGKDGIVFSIDKSNVAHRRKVKIAYLLENKVVIDKGLDDVDMIIATGGAYLSDGEKVEIAP